MHRLDLLAHERANLDAQLDESARAQRVEPDVRSLRLDDRVVVAAVRDVDCAASRSPAHRSARRWQRDSSARCGCARDADPIALAHVCNLQQPRRHFDAQLARRARSDEAVLEAEGEDADRSVAAHRQAAAGLDEEDPDVGVGTSRRIQKAAAHHVVAARLEAQPGADPVEALHEIEPALAPWWRRAAAALRPPPAARDCRPCDRRCRRTWNAWSVERRPWRRSISAHQNRARTPTK